MNPPDHVWKLMQERAERLSKDPIRQKVIARALVEAWVEGYKAKESEA